MYLMLLLITIAIAFSAYAMVLYNKVIPAQGNADNNWHMMASLLQKRVSIVTHLIELCKQNKLTPDPALAEILSQIRSYTRQYGHYPSGIKGRIALECNLTEKLSELLNQAKENSGINTNMHFLNMQQMLVHVDEQLAKTASEYNLAAAQINKELHFILNKWIIHFLGIHRLDTISTRLLFAAL